MQTLIDELVAAWQAHDALRACAFFAPEGVYQESGHPPIVGREAIFAHFQRFFRDGPGWRFEVEETLTDDERAAIRYRFALKGRAGAWQERDGCAFARRSGGLIIEWREYQG